MTKKPESNNSSFKSGAIVFILTAFSRVFGLLRELFIAYLFGTSNNADIVNVALRLPNLFRRIFGEGALSSVFVPLYSQLLHNSQKKANIFASQVFLLLTLVLLLITVFMQFFMPEIMVIITPGFIDDTAKFQQAVFQSRITIIYLIFICQVAFIGAILQTYGKYGSFAASPILMNIALVILTLGLYKSGGLSLITSISISLLATGILQLIFMLVPLKLSKFRFYFSNVLFLKQNNSNLKRFLARLAPSIASYGVIQVNLFISQSIASFIAGAVAILNYADRIYQLPLSLIGITFGTILLPNFSELVAKSNSKEMKKNLTAAIYYSQILALPCMIGLIMLAPPVTSVIYQRGAFSLEDTYNTANVLRIFALALPAFILVKVLNPIFYAYGDVKTPFKISLLTILINIGSNLILMHYFSYFGIALGTCISAWSNVVIIDYYLKNKLSITVTSKNIINKNNLKLLLAQFILVVVVAILDYLFLETWQTSYYLIKAIKLFSVIGISILCYITSIIFLELLSPEILRMFLPAKFKK